MLHVTLAAKRTGGGLVYCSSCLAIILIITVSCKNSVPHFLDDGYRYGSYIVECETVQFTQYSYITCIMSILLQLKFNITGKAIGTHLVFTSESLIRHCCVHAMMPWYSIYPPYEANRVLVVLHCLHQI